MRIMDKLIEHPQFTNAVSRIMPAAFVVDGDGKNGGGGNGDDGGVDGGAVVRSDGGGGDPVNS